MTVNEILKMDNVQHAIIELDTIVNELSDYGENLDKLTKSQKVLLFVENLEREVNNGGFYQFFWNSSGDYSSETFMALEEIEAIKTAELFKQVLEPWPHKNVPKDRTERQELLELIEEDAIQIWEQCEEEFFKYEEDISKLLFDYVKKYEEDFK